MKLRAIHSGGQTGADQGGLAAAVVLEIPTGGWAPKGFRTEEGLAPWLAQLGIKEHPSPEYAPRTELNVRETDGTLIFGDIFSPGSHLTLDLCLRHNKPDFVVSWKSGDPSPLGQVEGFRRWIVQHNIEVMNVAGNRESKQPGIRDAVRIFLVTALSC